ncbi:hypothetical protein [Fusobacterium ulcerans]|uniref:hypothetical protein n=1 Tax=Fusobacterium ulcerans TaxID=861 RepID=UPI00309DFC08
MGRGKSRVKKRVKRRKEKEEKRLQAEELKKEQLIISKEKPIKINEKNIDPYNFSTINVKKKRVPRFI